MRLIQLIPNQFKIFHSSNYSRTIQTIIPNISEVLEWFKDGLLKAVPKKKTSYSKKRMRAAGKGLKNLKNIVRCYACGQPKLMHQICQSCLKSFRAKLKDERTNQLSA